MRSDSYLCRNAPSNVEDRYGNIHNKRGKDMKILVADNHTLFREGFSRQLQRFGALTELQEVTDFAAVEKLGQERKVFDLIFVDRDVLGADWKESFKKTRAMFAAARLIVTGESESRGDILDAFGLGASGYIPKKSSDSLIINALRLIVDGNAYVPPAVLDGMRRTGESGRILSHALPDGKNLTGRQSEVLQHLSNGLSNKQIAYEMSVSEATVKLHINALLRHLHVENRTKAVVTAQRLGILQA